MTLTLRSEVNFSANHQRPSNLYHRCIYWEAERSHYYIKFCQRFCFTILNPPCMSTMHNRLRNSWGLLFFCIMSVRVDGPTLVISGTQLWLFLCGAPNQKKTALLGRERKIKYSFFLNMCNLQSCSSEILELENRARTAF